MTCLSQSGQVVLFAFYLIFSNLSACVNLAFYADALLAPDSKSGTLHLIFLVSHCANKFCYIY